MFSVYFSTSGQNLTSYSGSKNENPQMFFWLCLFTSFNIIFNLWPSVFIFCTYHKCVARILKVRNHTESEIVLASNFLLKALNTLMYVFWRNVCLKSMQRCINHQQRFLSTIIKINHSAKLNRKTSQGNTGEHTYVRYLKTADTQLHQTRSTKLLFSLFCNWSEA